MGLRERLRLRGTGLSLRAGTGLTSRSAGTGDSLWGEAVIAFD